ncbi:MAG TPA: metalloregulator ArsR/SmtB family transcription factor [Thermoanaerobaculia bacterium]|nr:metalloregulator ArsR/SmtB family transcription factor [Thermoanaerobaculia bacterium]
MKSADAVASLAALAQESRLEIFRRLVQRGPEGMPAGEIAAALAIAKPTLSFHLAHLERAGLARARRDGRSILYSADFDAIAALVGFLYENCCGTATSCAPPRRKR